MENQELKIILQDTVGKEITVRHGQALPLKEPTKLDINGTIDAPLLYIRKRNANIDPMKAILIVNQEVGTIKFIEDEKNPYSNVITGKMEAFPALTATGINTPKYYTLKDLTSLIKMNKYYFLDKDLNASMIMQLMAFKAQVQVDIENSGDNKGNSNKQIQKQTTWGRELAFVLNMPIFKGCDSRRFTVETCFEITDGGVNFWLESVELHELVLSEKASKIEDILKNLHDDYTVIFE